MMTHATQKAIWSIPLAADDVSEAGRHVDRTADAATRAAIAQALGIRSLEQFDFSLDVTRRGRDGLNVSGQVRALVGQSCVVTLDPMESEVRENVDVDFLPSAAWEAASAAVDLNSERDPPELLLDGAVDLGELAVEFLILGINPYPRKPDAEFALPGGEREDTGPFAALAKLKRPPDSGN